MAENFEVLCPCCETTLVIDRVSGEILLSREKERKNTSTIESMFSQLETRKQEAAKKFEKNMESEKDRARLLDEKFKEAMARADKSDKRPVNPMDLD